MSKRKTNNGHISLCDNHSNSLMRAHAGSLGGLPMPKQIKCGGLKRVGEVGEVVEMGDMVEMSEMGEMIEMGEMSEMRIANGG